MARPKPRSIDKLLSDVGLNAQQIAALLGKTDRAVNLVLAGEREKKAARPKRARAATEPSPEGEV